MGRVGAAGDNAAMESFFALLQKNVLNRRTWTTREQLRIAIGLRRSADRYYRSGPRRRTGRSDGFRIRNRFTIRSGPKLVSAHEAVSMD